MGILFSMGAIPTSSASRLSALYRRRSIVKLVRILPAASYQDARQLSCKCTDHGRHQYLYGIHCIVSDAFLLFFVSPFAASIVSDW
jgi:hypothetical protein